MKVSTPEIVWHGKEPVFSADFHRNGPNWRLATGGADNDVKMWRLSEVEGKTRVEYLSSLSRHTKAVNVVRFSPNGEYLATASDDSVVCVWKQGSCAGGGNLMTEECTSNKENWTVVKMLRGHLEDVYDLCWSPDSHFFITGSVDSTAIVWDVVKGEKLSMLSESKQYIQGVTWDPLGAFVVTFSCDRNVRVYSVDSKFKCLHNVNRLSIPDQGGGTRQFRMWADEGLSSFFRRLSFSPDGSLLIVPAGRFEGDKPHNCTYIFARSNLSKPVLQLRGPDKPTIVVRWCPVLFESWVSHGEEGNSAMLFSLPYRMVYAVASLDAVFLYDTQQTAPFGFLSNIHYASITDLTWSNDGHTLVVTSSDGYCSLVTFHPGELGSPLEQDKLPSVIAQHQSKQPAAADPGVKSPPPGAKSSPPGAKSPPPGAKSPPPGAKSPSPVQSGAKDTEGAESKASAVKPRRIRPTTITSFGSPEEKQESKSPSPSSSTQKQLNSSQEACVGGGAPETKSPRIEGGAPSSQSPRIEGGTPSSQLPCVEGGTLVTEVSQKKPSGPRRVNFVTLSSPAPKHPDSEPMEVQIIE